MAQFRAGTTIGRVWNGLEWIGDDSEWKNLEIGVSARERSNVGTRRRMAGIERSNVHAKRLNVEACGCFGAE